MKDGYALMAAVLTQQPRQRSSPLPPRLPAGSVTSCFKLQAFLLLLLGAALPALIQLHFEKQVSLHQGWASCDTLL